MSIPDWENILADKEIRKDNMFRKKFPYMFRVISEPNSQYKRFAEISIDEGWWQLFHNLCQEIDEYLDTPEKKEQFRWIQVKEKFGSLRAYCHLKNTAEFDNEISNIVCKYERFSNNICERCGKPGKRRETGWIKVLCDEHYKETLENQRKYFGE